MAFIAILIAGSASNFATIDWDELDSPDFGIEASALPSALVTSESVLLQKRSMIPRRIELPHLVLAPNSAGIVPIAPQSIPNFCCRYKHVPERAPPILQI